MLPAREPAGSLAPLSERYSVGVGALLRPPADCGADSWPLAGPRAECQEKTSAIGADFDTRKSLGNPRSDFRTWRQAVSVPTFGQWWDGSIEVDTQTAKATVQKNMPREARHIGFRDQSASGRTYPAEVGEPLSSLAWWHPKEAGWWRANRDSSTVKVWNAILEVFFCAWTSQRT